MRHGIAMQNTLNDHTSSANGLDVYLF
eukprot:COSAG06_NODE_44109_length_366_cov_0.584270_1_plen_26_part_10